MGNVFKLYHCVWVEFISCIGAKLCCIDSFCSIASIVLRNLLIAPIFSLRVQTCLSSEEISGTSLTWSYTFQLVVTDSPNFYYYTCISMTSSFISFTSFCHSSSSKLGTMFRYSWISNSYDFSHYTTSPTCNTCCRGTLFTCSTGSLGTLSYVAMTT